MSIWLLLGIVFVAGGAGGIINSLISDNGFPLPKVERNDGILIVRPGFFGNIITGAVAASISWGLYGPLSLAVLPMPGTGAQTFGMTLSALLGAVLVGVGGARWLTNEVDKKFWRATASMAADASASSEMSRKMMIASPAEAFNMAMEMQTRNLSVKEPSASVSE